MTKADIKRKLNTISYIDDEIRILDSKIERYEAITQAHAIRYDLDKVQTTPTDPVAKAMEKLYGLMEIRRKRQEQMIKAVAEAADLIDMVKDAHGRLVLHYRYINALSWREVAKRTNFAERHVYRLHDDAINEIYQKCQLMSVNVS